MADTNDYVNGIIQETGEDVTAMALNAGYIANHNRAIRQGIRIAKPISKVFPWTSAALLAEDAGSGYRDAGANYHTSTPSMKQKAASIIGSAVNGLSFGVVPANKVMYGLVPNTLDIHPPSSEDIRSIDFMNKFRQSSGLGTLNVKVGE